MFRALLFAGLDIFQLGNTMMHLFTETLIRAASLQNGIVSEGSMVYSALLLVGLVLLLDVIESNWIRGRAEISGHSKQEISFISSLKAAMDRYPTVLLSGLSRKIPLYRKLLSH